MSTELEQLTGAGGTISLGGRTLLLKQLSLGDFGQIQAWLKQRLPRPFAIVAEALKDLEPLRAFDPEGYEYARKQLVVAAMADIKEGDGMGASHALVDRVLNGPEGLSFILWLCIKKEHPDVTCEQVEKWLHGVDLTEIKKKLDDITIFAAPDDGDDGEDAVGTADPLEAPRSKT